MNSFNSRSVLKVGGTSYTFFRLSALEEAGLARISRLPFSIRILLENLLRHEDGRLVRREEVEALARWSPTKKSEKEISFIPARVLLQDFTGVPAVVDLATMRDAIRRLGGDPKRINPLQPVDLVIDHSVQVDRFGTPEAFRENTKIEFDRNLERYQFLRWGQSAFENFRVVPPGTGIVHQVNLEYLASVIFSKKEEKELLAYPDTLVGTDSHTTMINGLGVVGWGVGGIEAEAAMLGQPISMLIPEVVGFKLKGTLREGVTATDLVLTVTERLRKKGVVGKFVEFYGPGISSLSLPNRATLGNMAPEYGATLAFFPVDQETLNYLRLSGRPKERIDLVEAYCKEQNLFHTPKTPDPEFSDSLELDLETVEACLAGPKRPQDRVALKDVQRSFQTAFSKGGRQAEPAAPFGGQAKPGEFQLRDGSVVIAAITSCTNTSNPQVMIGAGLVAKKAVERGLEVKPWVKTSLAPGSKVVIDYLRETKLLEALEKLKFHLVGFGCTTCIGNSGPLPEPIAQAVKDNDLVAAAVLSGNRNFEGRINPLVRANYLASPPLVVAYALAGTLDIDLTKEPLGKDPRGNPVYLRDLWPTTQEIQKEMRAVSARMFQDQYAHVFEGEKEWQSIQIPAGDTFGWDSKSTYIKNPPYFESLPVTPVPLREIEGARVLVVVGDSVTTDHISPAGSISPDGPAGKYLIGRGISQENFNSYGSRRGNHEVMMRGTFANLRLKNLLVPGTEGGWTRHFPKGEKLSIFDAAMRYQQEKTPLIVMAGKEYGSGSSRDWAAKGPALLGVRAVMAESFERIHRSNLIGMGILPLQFEAGQTRESLGLTGEEIYSIEGIAEGLAPGKQLTVRFFSPHPHPLPPVGREGRERGEFTVLSRIDTPVELSYYQHGGILPYVLRQLLKNP